MKKFKINLYDDIVGEEVKHTFFIECEQKREAETISTIYSNYLQNLNKHNVCYNIEEV